MRVTGASAHVVDQVDARVPEKDVGIVGIGDEGDVSAGRQRAVRARGAGGAEHEDEQRQRDQEAHGPTSCASLIRSHVRKSCAVIGCAIPNPCAASQPSALTTPRPAAVSTPCATTRHPIEASNQRAAFYDRLGSRAHASHVDEIPLQLDHLNRKIGETLEHRESAVESRYVDGDSPLTTDPGKVPHRVRIPLKLLGLQLESDVGEVDQSPPRPSAADEGSPGRRVPGSRRRGCACRAVSTRAPASRPRAGPSDRAPRDRSGPARWPRSDRAEAARGGGGHATYERLRPRARARPASSTTG